LKADLETEQKPSARWALHQSTVDRLVKIEEYIKAQFEAKRASKADLAEMRAIRLTAEIDLQREKSGPRAEQLAKFRRLLEDRRDAARTALKLSQELEEFKKRNGVDTIGDGPLLDLARMVLEAELA